MQELHAEFLVRQLASPEPQLHADFVPSSRKLLNKLNGDETGRFYEADNRRDQLLFRGFGLAMLVVIWIMKVWFWLEMHTFVLRELNASNSR